MTTKESDETNVDYDFLKKYIRDETSDNKKEEVGNFSIKNFQTSNRIGTEVFERDGDDYLSNNSDNKPNFNNKPWQKKEDGDSVGEEIFDEMEKEASSPMTKERQEFIRQMEEESLTVDTATKVNFDWKNN
jgi:hypothetical protein